MNIGVLALQGGFQLHQDRMSKLGASVHLIRNHNDLSIPTDGIILPGGESTTMAYLLKKHQLWTSLMVYMQKKPVFATCAGVILLQIMGILNIKITRNGYGRQINSGIFLIHMNQKLQAIKTEGIFIRAPIIEKICDDEIEILARHNHCPILLQKNKILAATFHPELSKDLSIHQYFLKLIEL